MLNRCATLARLTGLLKRSPEVLISIGNFKGGSAKTTSAIHIAAYMQTLGPTVLGDGDIVRASVKWAARGPGMLFKVVPIAQLAKEMRAVKYDHVVIDTEANPSDEEFKDIAKACDLLIIPTEADSTARERLIYTLAKLWDIGHLNHRVLITKAPPQPQTAALKLREELLADNIPLFRTDIPSLAAFKKASAQGTTIARVKGDRNVWKGRWPIVASGWRSPMHERKYGSIMADIQKEQEHPTEAPIPSSLLPTKPAPPPVSAATRRSRRRVFT